MLGKKVNFYLFGEKTPGIIEKGKDGDIVVRVGETKYPNIKFLDEKPSRDEKIFWYVLNEKSF